MTEPPPPTSFPTRSERTTGPIRVTCTAHAMGDDAQAHIETDKQSHSRMELLETKFPDASYFPLSSITSTSSGDPTRLHVNTPRTSILKANISVPSGRAEVCMGNIYKVPFQPIGLSRKQVTNALAQSPSQNHQTQPSCSSTPSSSPSSLLSFGLKTSQACLLAPYVCSNTSMPMSNQN